MPTALHIDNGCFSYTLDPPVKVIVGEGDKQETQYVSPSLLSEKSDYFKGCLRGQLSEASNREIRLANLHPHTFQHFLRWLYTGDLAPFHEEQHSVDTLSRAIEIYVLGDRLLSTGLKDRCMDVMQACNDIGPSFTTADLKQVVGSGLSSSELWKYSLKQIAYSMTEDVGVRMFTTDSGWSEFAASTPAFVTEVLEAIEDLREEAVGENGEKKDPAAEEGCKWHEHGEDSDCNGIRWPAHSL